MGASGVDLWQGSIMLVGDKLRIVSPTYLDANAPIPAGQVYGHLSREVMRLQVVRGILQVGKVIGECSLQLIDNAVSVLTR